MIHKDVFWVDLHIPVPLFHQDSAWTLLSLVLTILDPLGNARTDRQFLPQCFLVLPRHCFLYIRQYLVILEVHGLITSLFPNIIWILSGHCFIADNCNVPFGLNSVNSRIKTAAIIITSGSCFLSLEGSYFPFLHGNQEHPPYFFTRVSLKQKRLLNALLCNA